MAIFMERGRGVPKHLDGLSLASFGLPKPSAQDVASAINGSVPAPQVITVQSTATTAAASTPAMPAGFKALMLPVATGLVASFVAFDPRQPAWLRVLAVLVGAQAVSALVPKASEYVPDGLVPASMPELPDWIAP